MPRETRAMTLARCLPADGSWEPDNIDLHNRFVEARGGYGRTNNCGGYHYYSGINGALGAGLIEHRPWGRRSFEARLTDKGRAAVAGGDS